MSLVLGRSLITAATRNERYHAFFSVFFLASLIVFISINLRILG